MTNYQYRDYQNQSIIDTLNFWESKPEKSCIIEAPTGSGKSIIVSGVIFEAMKRYNQKLKSVVIVPSKELCEQNAEKIEKMAPSGVSVGIFSASMGKSNHMADVVCATVGSIANKSDLFYGTSIVGIDECHRVNPDGKGDYWKFINGLSENSNFRLFGLTATPFRGNGVWITDGKRPMFHGFSHRIKLMDMLNRGYLSPLITPNTEIRTKIFTDDVPLSGSDFNIKELSKRTAKYLINAADDAIKLAVDRNKWIAFLPDIETANDFSKILNSKGITCGVVTGETDKKEREFLISQFKKGYIRSLVTVLALSTGFDVPDIDCILWLRSTHSPVLYIQGAGRGLRIHDNKSNCLWLDFTDTTERLGPLDKITGRKKKRSLNDHAPCVICDNCGESIMPASAIYCPNCGATLRVIDDIEERFASDAEILVGMNPTPTINITHAGIHEEKTKNNKSYISVRFYNMMSEVCRENLFFSGIAISQSSLKFWLDLTGDYAGQYNSYTACLNYLNQFLGFDKAFSVKSVTVDRTKKYPKLLSLNR